MKLKLSLLPVWIVVADLLGSVLLNIKEAMLPERKSALQDGLPISPEFAFGWIQVLVNSTMVLVILLAIFMLLHMKKLSDAGERIVPDITRAGAVLTVLAFSMPALWLWCWAGMTYFTQGYWTVSFEQPRYVVVAACQPYLVWLAIDLWRTQYRLYHQQPHHAQSSSAWNDEHYRR